MLIFDRDILAAKIFGLPCAIRRFKSTVLIGWIIQTNILTFCFDLKNLPINSLLRKSWRLSEKRGYHYYTLIYTNCFLIGSYNISTITLSNILQVPVVFDNVPRISKWTPSILVDDSLRNLNNVIAYDRHLEKIWGCNGWNVVTITNKTKRRDQINLFRIHLTNIPTPVFKVLPEILHQLLI